MVTALSILCSPPRSGVFIVVVQVAIGLPSHPFLKFFLFQPPKQIKSVVSSLASQSSRLSGVRPSSHIFFSLVVSGRRSLSLVEALPFLGFDIRDILPGESYNRSLCACGIICLAKGCQQAFWRRCRGTIATLGSELISRTTSHPSIWSILLVI